MHAFSFLYVDQLMHAAPNEQENNAVHMTGSNQQEHSIYYYTIY